MVTTWGATLAWSATTVTVAGAVDGRLGGRLGCILSGVVAGAAAPQREEGLLRDVVGDAAAPAHPVGEGERPLRVAIEYHLERARLTVADELHQILVCENAKPGNPATEWDVQNGGDASITTGLTKGGNEDA